MPPQSSQPSVSADQPPSKLKANEPPLEATKGLEELVASLNIGATDQKLLDQMEILSKVR